MRHAAATYYPCDPVIPNGADRFEEFSFLISGYLLGASRRPVSLAPFFQKRAKEKEQSSGRTCRGREAVFEDHQELAYWRIR